MKLKNKLIFTLFMLIIFTNKVSAKMINVDEIVQEFPNTQIISELKELGSEITLVADQDNNKLKLIYGNKTYATYDYTDEYIEYDNRNTQITEEIIESNFAGMLGMMGITMAMINKSGYENKFYDTNNINQFENQYETYGLNIKTEKYDITTSSGSMTGDFLRYFKLSLNTEKISKLVEDYGVNIDDVGNKLYEITPSLSTEEISDKYIKLYVKADAPQNQNLTCIIYKSTSLNGDYEGLFEVGNNCENGAIVTDNDIIPGNTYYYKAVILGSSTKKYSTPVAVTIPKKEKITTNNTETIDKNPKTSDLPIIIIYIIGCVSLIYSVIYFKKIHQ